MARVNSIGNDRKSTCLAVTARQKVNAMRPHKLLFKLTFVAAAGGLVLSGCGSRNTTTATDKSVIPGQQPGIGKAPGSISARNDDPAITKRLLAAAEPFEALTETAFTDTPAKLDASILACRSAARNVQGDLPSQAFARMNVSLDAIQSARGTGNSADLALASIEAYRTLVSSVPGTPVVPVDVSLLDYAGFRYNADAQATPPRWDDMARAIGFARQRWASLENKGLSATLTRRFVGTLDAMEAAVKQHNLIAARSSAKAELDLVDELEAAFQPPVPPKA